MSRTVRPAARALVPAASVLLACALLATQEARATCGSASCFLVTSTDQGLGASGVLRADLSFRYVDQSRPLEGSSHADTVLVPKIDFENETIEPDHHREIRTLYTAVQVDLTYGLATRWALAASLPLYNDRAHEHFDDAGTPDEHFTSSDGTRGFGDLQLGARYALWLRPKDLLVGGLALKMPTGPYKLLDSEGAINEPTIQPGTGSWDTIASLAYSRHPRTSGPEWFASASYRLNTENSLRYEIGDEGIANGGVILPIGTRVEASAQVNYRHTARDRFQGNAVDSTGASMLNLTPGVRYNADSGASFYGFFQLPVWQDVNERQLAPRYGFVLGVSKAF